MTTLTDLDRAVFDLLPAPDSGRYPIHPCVTAAELAERITAARPKVSASLKRLRDMGLAYYEAPYSVRPVGWHRTAMGQRAYDAGHGRVLHAVERKENGGVTTTRWQWRRRVPA